MECITAWVNTYKTNLTGLHLLKTYSRIWPTHEYVIIIYLYIVFAVIPESNSGGFNETEFEFYIWDRLLSFWAPLWDEETGQDIAEAMYWNYKPWPYVEDEYANRDRVNEVNIPVNIVTKLKYKPWQLGTIIYNKLLCKSYHINQYT